MEKYDVPAAVHRSSTTSATLEILVGGLSCLSPLGVVHPPVERYGQCSIARTRRISRHSVDDRGDLVFVQQIPHPKPAVIT